VERVIDVLKLSANDPVIVAEAARGLGVIAKGKGADKASHLTVKVCPGWNQWYLLLMP
jgi:DNA repair/transcription protein MET18/MMS19